MDKRFAKEILKEGGVKVFQKDIKDVKIHNMHVVEHEIAGGDLPPDYMSHRGIILVTMNDGTVYEVLRETVDKDGNFSTTSAKWVTRSVRKK